LSNAEIFWLCVGFSAQALFTARFLVQWLASERKGESVIPLAFWYLSLTGGVMLLLYAVYRKDPVIITGQAFGVVVYLRNLFLIGKKRGNESNEPPATVSLPSEGAEPALEAGLRKAG
jgi:lipid-A-disaccharide synthase-like uncharacterized protein